MSLMNRVFLVSWDKTSLKARIVDLKNTGFDVISGVPKNRDFFKGIEDASPQAILIDLTRSPSQGRDVAVNLRIRKPTRFIPLLFLAGSPDAIDSIHQLLPDAIFCQWEKVDIEIQKALKNPLSNPLVPTSIFAAYHAVPLYKKLGIKQGMSLLAIHPPVDVDTFLSPLPEGIRISQNDSGKFDILLWFTKSQSELSNGIREIAARKDFKSIWIVWPKKTSSLVTDLTQQVVRKVGLDHGLVDYKICSLNDTWTGLCFARRKPSIK
jgi:hypothetical protein